MSLFNLKDDPGETKDVANDNPAVVKQLTALADEFRRDLGDALSGATGNGLRQPGRDDGKPDK